MKTTDSERHLETSSGQNISREFFDAESTLQGQEPVYPVVINFPFKGQQRSESLIFSHPIDSPSHGTTATLKFNDFGTMRRISGSVEHAIHEFYGPGSINGVNAGYIIQIFLTAITEQPL